ARRGATGRASAADGYAALGAGLDVERVVPGSGGDEELEFGKRLDDLAWKRGAFAHPNNNREALKCFDRLVLIRERLFKDLNLDVFGDSGPIGKCHCHVFIVVENSCPNHAKALSLAR